MCQNVAKVVGGVFCKRFGVPGLEPEEVLLAGGALAELVKVYNLAQMDPKTAAWLGVGVVGFALAAPRYEIYEKRRQASPAPKAPPAAAAPATAVP